MKRTGGRPPLDAAGASSVPVHVKMAPRDYDEAYRRARQERVSVPELIRRDVRAAAAIATKRNPK